MQATFSVSDRFTISLDYSSLTSQYAQQPGRNYVNIIGKYTHLQKVCRQYDHRGAAATNLLITLFHARDPRLIAYPVGGSSVINCAGKGVIDLLGNLRGGRVDQRIHPSAAATAKDLTNLSASPGKCCSAMAAAP